MTQEKEKRTLKDLWHDTFLAAGIPTLSLDRSARIMAAIYKFGNNEDLTEKRSLAPDLRYIQQRFGIMGGEKPDPEFVRVFNLYVKELEEYERTHTEAPIAPWVKELFYDRYNIVIRY